MKRICPHCEKNTGATGLRKPVRRAGRYRRKSDLKVVLRYRCYDCTKTFSTATTDLCFGQKKRQYNSAVFQLGCSSVSIRRIAGLLNLNRKTIASKQLFLGRWAAIELERCNRERDPCATMEFDDLETFEHTKLKPLSVCLAVDPKTRWILGFRVAQMAAKGKLAKLSLKKYGRRKDERHRQRRELFRDLSQIVSPVALIKSDQNPHYDATVKRFFPTAEYRQYKGQRGSIVGQGELKKIRFDPLFILNHTCAMLRANINRLVRRTWCTTKKADRLVAHISMYVIYHNLILLESS